MFKWFSSGSKWESQMCESLINGKEWKAEPVAEKVSLAREVAEVDP